MEALRGLPRGEAFRGNFSRVAKLYAVDTPTDGRSIALQSEIRKLGMKTISLPGKHSFLNWRLVIVHWLFAEGAGYRLSNIGDSPEA